MDICNITLLSVYREACVAKFSELMTLDANGVRMCMRRRSVASVSGVLIDDVVVGSRAHQSSGGLDTHGETGVPPAFIKSPLDHIH